ncbi:alpha-hydroxy-acid oxidizing protein [Methanolobus sp. ZRKC2]|uniref:alpha-hydroxy-acid oxidizing protein n=1 Tax=Methanolobus sp. ZRKC2 TaxID=3125783 RepID=UPI00325363D7
MGKGEGLGKWYCSVCNVYHYDEEIGDPETGIEPGTSPSDFPDSWRCPICGATRDKLKMEESRGEENTEFKIGKGPAQRYVKREIISTASDNPAVQPEYSQEYGRSLGLAAIGQGITYLNNFRALERVLLRTRLISEHQNPVIKKDFFGTEVCMPLFAAPMGGLSYFANISEEDFSYSVLEGCRLADTIGFTGDTAKDYTTHAGILSLKKVHGHGINVFKPRSQDMLINLMKKSEKGHAFAVGIDIDGAGSVNFTLAGKPVYRKTVEDLKELKNSTNLPFMVKGIMCPEDATLAMDAGANIIGISNHGGRVLDSAPGVADVLPDIVRAIRDAPGSRHVIITADGGVRTGFDVVKMLALGADFVLMGRPIARQVLASGASGVKELMDFLKTDIIKAMIMTSCNKLEDINENILTTKK